MRGAADRILSTLEAFGFEWEAPVVRQSGRTQDYSAAFDRLAALGLTYACSCSRAQLDGVRYPGTCRDRALPGVDNATRLRLDPWRVEFVDQVQGAVAQDVEQAAGDPVIRRRDGLFAYLLAVVVDDAAQGVTHIVRGADLLDSTPRQIHLQRLLCYAEPMYAHVPVLTESDGAKLAKSRRSVALDTHAALAQLVSVFTLLGMPALPKDFAHLQDAWRWAHGAWSLNKVPKRMNLSVTS